MTTLDPRRPARLASPAPARYAATISLVARATAVDCFAVLTDFEAYPRWSSHVRACQVMVRGRDGLARDVAFELEIARRRVRYQLTFHYVPPRRASWALVRGDLAGVSGAYSFEQNAAGVLITCTQAIDVGFWIPELIRRPLEQRALRRSVEEFRSAVETRASGWA